MEAAEADRLFKDMLEPAVAGGQTEETDSCLLYTSSPYLESY